MSSAVGNTRRNKYRNNGNNRNNENSGNNENNRKNNSKNNNYNSDNNNNNSVFYNVSSITDPATLHEEEVQHLNKVKKVLSDVFSKLLKGAPLTSRFNIKYIPQRANPMRIEIGIRRCKEIRKLSSRWYPSVIIKQHSNGALEMYIESLTSCTPTSLFLTNYKKSQRPMPANFAASISGKTILEGFIKVARELDVDYITLEDASSVYYGKMYGRYECGINFAILSILQKGESWYQQMGFLPQLYGRTENDREQSRINENKKMENNKKIPKMKFDTLINMIAEKRRSTILYNMHLRGLRNKSLLDELRQNIKQYFPSINFQDTVSTVIGIMIQSIRDDDNGDNDIVCPRDPPIKYAETSYTPSKKLEILQQIVRLCTPTEHEAEPMIQYNPHRVLYLDEPNS